MVEFAMNDSHNASTGVSPFYANYGHHPRTPSAIDLPDVNPSATSLHQRIISIQQDIKTNMKKAQDRYKRFADDKREEQTFEKGDWVLLEMTNIKTSRPSRKLDHLRYGPYQIVAVMPGGRAYTLDLQDRNSKIHPTFHVSLLSPYQQPLVGQSTMSKLAPDISEPGPVFTHDGTPEYEVEGFHGIKQINGEERYLVKWRGWDKIHNTYEPAEHLQTPETQMLLRKWLAANRKKVQRSRGLAHS